MTPVPHRARVILGATCYADADAALQIAVSLAKHMRADLHGCLVADDAILASVAFPNARVVTYAGRRSDAVTTQSMQAAFRTDARLFEKRLVAAARIASLRSAFSEASGQLASLLSHSADAGDLVVFGFRHAPRQRDGIVVILDDAKPDPPLLALGAELAKSQQTRLTVFADPALHSDLSAALQGLRGQRYNLVPARARSEVLTSLEAMSPIAVFVSHSPAEAIKRLIDAARCPVVVPMAKQTGRPEWGT